MAVGAIVACCRHCGSGTIVNVLPLREEAVRRTACERERERESVERAEGRLVGGSEGRLHRREDLSVR